MSLFPRVPSLHRSAELTVQAGSYSSAQYIFFPEKMTNSKKRERERKKDDTFCTRNTN